MKAQDLSDAPEVGWKYSPSLTKIKYLKKYAVGADILEVGSGMGWYSKFLKESGFSVTAVDINPLTQIEGVELIKSDFISVDLNGRSFDTVVMFDVLEHIADEKAALLKVKDICKRRLIMSVPNKDDAFLVKYNLTYSHFRDRTHFREYSIDQIKRVIEENCFSAISLRLEGPVMPQVLIEFLNLKLGFLKVPLRKFITLLEKLHFLSLENTCADIFIVADKK